MIERDKRSYTYSCSWCRIDFQNSMGFFCPLCGREAEKYRGYGKGIVVEC